MEQGAAMFKKLPQLLADLSSCTAEQEPSLRNRGLALMEEIIAMDARSFRQALLTSKMEPLVVCETLTKIQEHSLASDYKVCCFKGSDYSQSLAWKSLQVQAKLFWAAGCPHTRDAVINLVTTRPEYSGEGIQAKVIMQLVAVMNGEAGPGDELQYYRSVFPAALDVEELVNARRDEMFRLEERQVLDFMIHIIAIMLQPFFQPSPSREMRKELEADSLRVREVLCSRVLDSENGYPAEVREAALFHMRGMERCGFRLFEGPVLWKFMQFQHKHVLYRLLDVLHLATEEAEEENGGFRNWVRQFLWGIWPSCTPFDKRCVLFYTSCWWQNSSWYDNESPELLRDFEVMVLKDWQDTSQQAYKKLINDAVAKSNTSVLDFHYQAEEILARQLFAFHNGVSPEQNSEKNYQRSALFITNLLIPSTFDVQKMGSNVSLLEELLNGPNGAEYLSTLHKMWFDFYAQELYSMTNKLHGRKLIIFLDKFRNWDFVFEWLMKQAEHWREIRQAALMFGKMVYLLTSAGNPKPGSEQRRIWGQYPDTISWLMSLASELLKNLPSLTESLQGDPELSLAFNLLAARLQVLGEQIAKYSPTAILTERYSCIREAMDSALGCDILPARFLPRLIEPQVKEEQRLEHLRMLKALVRDQTGDIYCRDDGAGRAGQNGDQNDELEKASKAAAKALKKKRQKEKRERSLQEAKGESGLENAAAALQLA